MRALVSCQEPPFAQIAEAPDPVPRPDEAVVAVQAVSLNRGESHRLRTTPPGTVAGWDLAGEVVQAAASGEGPPAGARVVGMLRAGAWAQRAAVPAEFLAELPSELTYEAASTLPVAGVTALRSLELGGFLVGKRALITGASGGVGRFAIQLARMAGAHVTTVSRRTEGLRELGADETLTELAPGEGEDFDVILDALGGPVLGVCLQRVVPGGVVISFASTLTDPVEYPTRELFARAPGARLYGLYVFAELAHTRTASSDLRRLADLVAAGRLDPQIDVVLPWDRAGEAIEALLDRRVAGKAVLTIG
jgi:NADPH:quinone reductase-like Zn-dependent oxidoreductase